MKSLKKPLALLVSGAVLATSPAFAQTPASKAEAVAMVKKAVAFYKSDGKDKAFAAFNTNPGPFTDRDLYVVAYDTKGTCLAHGQNAKLPGKNLIDSEDADGKLFVKERVELAKTKNTFWQDYKFRNPVSKKIEDKTTYCEKTGEVLICAGVYK